MIPTRSRKTPAILAQEYSRCFTCFVRFFAMVANCVDTCEVAQCRFDDGCWRPRCPHRHSERGRAAMWARVWLTLAAVEKERLAQQKPKKRKRKCPRPESLRTVVEGISVEAETLVSCEGVRQLTAEQVGDAPQFRKETVGGHLSQANLQWVEFFNALMLF